MLGPAVWLWELFASICIDSYHIAVYVQFCWMFWVMPLICFRKVCCILGRLPHSLQEHSSNYFPRFPPLLKYFCVAACHLWQQRITVLSWLVTIKTPVKTLVGGASNNKKIRDRVDSEDQYGRWKLWVMGSWQFVLIKWCGVYGNQRIIKDCTE